MALLPFPTALLSEYGGAEPEAVATYAATIALISLLHLALFLTLWRRPRLQARPVPDHVGWPTAIELGAVVVICAASVVLAFAVSPPPGRTGDLASVDPSQTRRPLGQLGIPPRPLTISRALARGPRRPRCHHQEAPAERMSYALRTGRTFAWTSSPEQVQWS